MAFLRTSGVNLRFLLSGPADGVPLVLLNSLGTDCRIWDGLLEHLDDELHVLRYDQRGQGLSEVPPGPYSIGDHASDVLALLDATGLDSVWLCGLSIGGLIAMEATLQRPTIVRGLVLADTAAKIGPPEVWDERIAQVSSQGLGPLAWGVMGRWFGAAYLREREGDARGWSNLLVRAPLDGYLGSCAALRDVDLTDRLFEIRVPALCICGTQDAATTPEMVRQLASQLDAEYIGIEGAGHMTPVERPKEFAGALQKFMEKNRDG